MSTHRTYGAGMIVICNGARWRVDTVEFWTGRERLTIRLVDGEARVMEREAWSDEVEFEAEVTA